MTELRRDLANNGKGGRRDGALAPSAPSSAPGPALPRRKGARPRHPSFEYEGAHCYHLVATTRDRVPRLVGNWAGAAVEAIWRAAEAASFEPLIFCVMPDHVHMLMLGTSPDANAVRFVQRFKQDLGHAYRRATDERLWQQSFYDHIVRKSEDVLPIAQYISGNPVEAGLVDDPLAWPYTGGTLLDEGSAPRDADGAEAPSLPTWSVQTAGEADGAETPRDTDGAEAPSLQAPSLQAAASLSAAVSIAERRPS